MLRVAGGCSNQPEPMVLKNMTTSAILSFLVSSLLGPALYPRGTFREVKTITKSFNCSQIFRILLIGFNCVPNPFYDYIDHAMLHGSRVGPDYGEQVIPAESPARIVNQIVKQPKFGWCQLASSALNSQRDGVRVDLNRVESDQSGLIELVASPQAGVNACQQLPLAKGLSYVIIGSCLQARHYIPLL